MRGCLRKAQNTKRGLPKGHSSWDIILPLGRGPNGKHKQKWVRFHGTKKQAEEKLTELAGEVHKGEFVEPSQLTLSEWLDEWLEKAIKPPRCTENTYATYSGVVKNHLKPALGQMALQQLSALDIERYYADLKLAPRSVAVHHTILSGALKAAVRAKKLRTNVAPDVMNKPRDSGHVLDNYWTAEEAKRFLDTVKADGSAQYAALFALALDSGVRKAELLGLRWTDLQSGTLHVDRQLLDGGNDELKFCPPKRGGRRKIDLSDETLALLKTHRAKQAELKLANRLHFVDHGLMFSQAWEHQTGGGSRLGNPLRMIDKQLKRLCETASVKPITMHGLRHTCATLLLAAGVPPHVVQKRLGHKKVEITLGVYAHVLPNQQADAAFRLSALLHG